jgi:hypothetical protein
MPEERLRSWTWVVGHPLNGRYAAMGRRLAGILIAPPRLH